MPNLPPSPADFAKLIARVETLERAQPDKAKHKLEQLDDVATPQPATGSVLVFDGVKWVPGSAGSGFPVGPEDNGTETGSVEFDTFAGASLPGALVMLRYDDGTPSDASFVGLFVPASGGVGAELRSNVGDVNVWSDNGDASLIAGGDAILSGARVFVGALPTSDPGNSGQLWNSSGTVMVSP